MTLRKELLTYNRGFATSRTRAMAGELAGATFAWLTFITGARRGELVALAWEHVDLISGLLTIRRNLVRRNAA